MLRRNIHPGRGQRREGTRTCMPMWSPGETPPRGSEVTLRMFYSFSLIRIPREVQRPEVIFFFKDNYQYYEEIQ